MSSTLWCDPAVADRPGERSDERDRLQPRWARMLSRRIEYVDGLDYGELDECALELDRYQEATLLAAAEETHLFRQMNLANYRAAMLRDLLDPVDPDLETAVEIQRLLSRSEQIRNRLAIVFSKLTISIARQLAAAGDSFEELISEGQATLLSAISKFDPERGFRFSTYATHAVRRRMLRHLRRRHRERQTFVNCAGELAVPDARRWTFAYEQRVVAAVRGVDQLLARLSTRERYILRSRFGWGREFEPRTLQQIADELGISRERVRQLESRSLAKLRTLAAREGLEGA